MHFTSDFLTDLIHDVAFEIEIELLGNARFHTGGIALLKIQYNINKMVLTLWESRIPVSCSIITCAKLIWLNGLKRCAWFESHIGRVR